jgi:hypothetical protein
MPRAARYRPPLTRSPPIARNARAQLLGRGLGVWHVLSTQRGLPLAIFAHALVFTTLVGIAAATSYVAPMALVLTLLVTLAALHGLVLSSGFVLAGNAGGEGGAAYAGVATQSGALFGAALQATLIHTGLIPVRA